MLASQVLYLLSHSAKPLSMLLNSHSLLVLLISTVSAVTVFSMLPYYRAISVDWETLTDSCLLHGNMDQDSFAG
jgi:hypothetical protein